MKKILIIDDEVMLRKAIGDYFEDHDYKVISSGNGRDGLALFQDEKPDAVFLDLNMPRIDGFKVVEVIKKDAPETPIVVISGIGIVSDAVRACSLGAWDFIVKPINDLEILSCTLDKVFERAQLIRKNQEYKEELEEKVKTRTAQLHKTNRSLKSTQIQIIEILARAGEYKDNETGKHVKRVSAYSGVISKALELPPEQINLIERTSALHDIGKIGLPESILLKKARLNKMEWKEMTAHCEYGFNILSQKSIENKDIRGNTELTGEILEYACNIALYHHEKWDGTGYPVGLQGEKIPMEARITALADVYDTLGNSRPFKKSFPENRCQSIIRELSGSHFDPSIVSAFFKSIDTILSIKDKWRDQDDI